MLLKNISTTRGLVNGARGVVIGFEKPEVPSKYPLVPRVRFSTEVGGQEHSEIYVVTEDSWDIRLGER